MKGRLLLFNRAAERVCRTTQAAMLGSDVRKMYPEGVAGQIMRAMRTGNGRIEGLRTEIVDSKGERVPVLLSSALIFEENQPVGSVGIFTDLRERMRMEQKLAQAQEQILQQERQAIIAELAGAAAHELNQPLTSIMGYADLHRGGADGGDRPEDRQDHQVRDEVVRRARPDPRPRQGYRDGERRRDVARERDPEQRCEVSATRCCPRPTRENRTSG
jgi:PAS domain S-box-containing protein